MILRFLGSFRLLTTCRLFFHSTSFLPSLLNYVSFSASNPYKRRLTSTNLALLDVATVEGKFVLFDVNVPAEANLVVFALGI